MPRLTTDARLHEALQAAITAKREAVAAERSAVGRAGPEVEEKAEQARATFDALTPLLYPWMQRFFTVRGIPTDVAQDLAQEALLRFWDHAQEVEHGLPWVYRTLQRTLLMHFRRTRQYREIPLHTIAGADEALIDTRPSPEAGALFKAVLEELARELSATDFRILQGLAAKTNRTELARSLGVSRNALYVRIHRLKKRVAVTLQRLYSSGA